LALGLLALVARTDPHPPEREHPPAWLATAEELLDPDSPEHPTLAGLAAEVGVHPAHLARVFRKHHGMSVGEYARTLRIDWAARRLAGSDTPIGLVALETGFCDQSHFTRTFKNHTGLTPARYRQATRSD
jgi:AraC family transcriptional regulator